VRFQFQEEKKNFAGKRLALQGEISTSWPSVTGLCVGGFVCGGIFGVFFVEKVRENQNLGERTGAEKGGAKKIRD